MVAWVTGLQWADGSGSEEKPEQGNDMVMPDQGETMEKDFFKQLEGVSQILSDSHGRL